MPHKPKGTGRPSVGRQVNIRLPDALMAKLEQVAERLGLDVSSTVRMLLTTHLEEYLDPGKMKILSVDELQPFVDRVVANVTRGLRHYFATGKYEDEGEGEGDEGG